MAPKRFSNIGNEIGLGPDSEFSRPSPGLESPFAQGPKSLPSAPGTQPDPMPTPMPSPGPSIPAEPNRTPASAEADSFDAAPTVSAAEFDSASTSGANEFDSEPIIDQALTKKAPLDQITSGEPGGIRGGMSYHEAMDIINRDPDITSKRIIEGLKEHGPSLAGGTLANMVINNAARSSSAFVAGVTGLGAVGADVLSRSAQIALDDISEFDKNGPTKGHSNAVNPALRVAYIEARKVIDDVNDFFKSSPDNQKVMANAWLSRELDEMRRQSIIFADNAFFAGAFNTLENKIGSYIASKASQDGLSLDRITKMKQAMYSSPQSVGAFDFQLSKSPNEFIPEEKKKAEKMLSRHYGKQPQMALFNALDKQQEALLGEFDSIVSKIVSPEVQEKVAKKQIHPDQILQNWLDSKKILIGDLKEEVLGRIGKSKLLDPEKQRLMGLIKRQMDDLGYIDSSGKVIEKEFLSQTEKDIKNEFLRIKDRITREDATINDFNSILDQIRDSVGRAKEHHKSKSGRLSEYSKEVTEAYYDALERASNDFYKNTGDGVASGLMPELRKQNALFHRSVDDVRDLNDAIARDVPGYLDIILKSGMARASEAARSKLKTDSGRTLTKFDSVKMILNKESKEALQAAFVNRLRREAMSERPGDFFTVQNIGDAMKKYDPGQVEFLLGGKKGMESINNILSVAQRIADNVPANASPGAAKTASDKMLQVGMAQMAGFHSIEKRTILELVVDTLKKMQYKNKSLKEVFQSDNFESSFRAAVLRKEASEARLSGYSGVANKIFPAFRLGVTGVTQERLLRKQPAQMEINNENNQ